MVRHRESLISAHHNYLVNDMLTCGFVLGDEGSREEFWFLADVVPVGEVTPRVSGRLFDGQGRLLLLLRDGHIVENPKGCIYLTVAGGFRLNHSSGETLLSVQTQVFTNGYLTRIQGRLHDRQGVLRMEPSYEGCKVYGEARLALNKPMRGRR